MWFLKNFVKKNTLKGLLCFSLCYAKALNTSFSFASSYPDSAVYRSPKNNSYKIEDEYSLIQMIKIIEDDGPITLNNLEFFNRGKRNYEDEKLEPKIYTASMIEASLEKKEKEITKEEAILAEEINEDLSEEEKKGNNSIKRNNKKLKDQIKEIRELIEKKNQEKKQEFDKAAEKLDSEESNPKTETIFKFIESFLSYLRLARKSDVLSIQKQSKEEAYNNQLAQVQKKFTKYVAQIASNSNIDKIISDLLCEDNSKVGSFFNCIVYTPAWEEQTQLELIEHINTLKDATIRCGFGLVHEGSADSRGIIPLISSRFARFNKAPIVNNFTYGFKKYFSGRMGFEERDYPDTMNIYQDKLKISPEVIQKMQKKDDEWYKFDKYYDSKFFKSGFGLAGVREFLAYIYQKHASLYLQIWENLTQFKNWEELVTKAIFENTVFVLQDTLFGAFVLLMTPISFFDNILYIIG